jgi:hypothetical protein
MTATMTILMAVQTHVKSQYVATELSKALKSVMKVRRLQHVMQTAHLLFVETEHTTRQQVRNVMMKVQAQHVTLTVLLQSVAMAHLTLTRVSNVMRVKLLPHVTLIVLLQSVVMV